jgi:hypothetical protein
MSYIFNMLICVDMILLDNMSQCFLFIAMIDLSRTCGSVTSLIYYALVMFMIYSCIHLLPLRRADLLPLQPPPPSTSTLAIMILSSLNKPFNETH